MLIAALFFARKLTKKSLEGIITADILFDSMRDTKDLPEKKKLLKEIFSRVSFTEKICRLFVT